MRVVAAVEALLLAASLAAAEGELTSPYRHQSQSGLRGLDAREMAELRAGTGMGLARVAELNSYPGPRHVLDANEAGQFPASSEQIEQVRSIFEAMRGDAKRVGARILDEEGQLETAFRTATITEPDLRARVARIAALQGELRVIHLRAHVATRAILSDAQVARYNALRGYTAGEAEPEAPPHRH